MLRSTALFFASLLPATMAAAAPPATKVIERDGHRFEYAVQLDAEDNVQLTGRVLDDGTAFRLVVRPSGRVAGEFGASPVSFRVDRKVRDSLVAALAAPAPVQVAELATVRR